jgi:prepilin peptidase CpaA
MQGLTLPLLLILSGASAWAVREDLLAHRISNSLSGSVLAAGLTLQLIFGGWSALGQALLGTLVGLAVLLPLYVLRATGAGDVKLLGGFGALLGPHWALLAGGYTLLAGAVLGIVYLAHGALRAALAPVGVPWVLRLHTACACAQQMRRQRFPYALAIAIGAISAVAQRGDLHTAFDHLSELVR